VHPLARNINKLNTEPLPEARTQANSGGIYGRGASDERTRSAGATPSGRDPSSAENGVDLRSRRQVGGGSCGFARGWPMAAEWRGVLGGCSAICEAEELERVGGVNGV
jgi:hypothetical protein